MLVLPMPSRRRNDDSEIACAIREGARDIRKGLHAVAQAIDGLNPKPDPKPKVHFNFEVGPVTLKERPHMPLETSITNEQKVKVTLKPVTQSGKPASIDGKATFSVVSGDSTFVASDDGLSADLVSSDTPGDTQFLVEADVNMSPDVVETISDIIKLTVIGANASSLGLAVGTPELK